MVGNASTGREVSRLISYTSVCLIFTPVGYNLKQWPGFYKNIIFTRQMCFGAAPSILFRPFHDSGLHRVQFYILRCTSDIVRPLEKKRISPDSLVVLAVCRHQAEYLRCKAKPNKWPKIKLTPKIFVSHARNITT